MPAAVQHLRSRKPEVFPMCCAVTDAVLEMSCHMGRIRDGIGKMHVCYKCCTEDAVPYGFDEENQPDVRAPSSLPEIPRSK
jgi:hypothetical protein